MSKEQIIDSLKENVVILQATLNKYQNVLVGEPFLIEDNLGRLAHRKDESTVEFVFKQPRLDLVGVMSLNKEVANKLANSFTEQGNKCKAVLIMDYLKNKIDHINKLIEEF